MKRALLLVLFFIVSAASVSALDLHHGKVFSFTHFLSGNSGVFPCGCSLNAFIWKVRSGRELADDPVFNRLIALVKKSAESFKDLHRFECAFYKAAVSATETESLARFLADTTGEDRAVCSDLLVRLFDDFTRYFYPEEKLIEAELNALGESQSFRHFSALLEQQKAAFGCTAVDLNLKISLIPVYASSEEFARFKNSGKFSIFGLSLDEIQLIEVPIIQGAPEITSRATYHLNAVALHEINHFLYHGSDFFKLANEFFQTSGNKNARLAGSYFAETLATACGQGMAQLVYKTEDPQWYDSRVINRLAHEFFSAARQYLERGQAFDSDFLMRYLEVFATVYPDARLVPDIAFTRFSLSFPGIEADDVPASEFKTALMKFLPMYRTVDLCDADNETLLVEVFLRDEGPAKRSSQLMRSNILSKTLFNKRDLFLIYRQFSATRPAKITFFLNSKNDFMPALGSLFEATEFQPIIKL